MEENDEILKQWEPIPNLSTVLYLVSVYDDIKTLTIFLEPKIPTGHRLKVQFDSALLYRKGDEGDLLKTVFARKDLGKWPLLTVENSELLNWFYAQQYNDPNPRNLTHYLFVTPNDLLDVLALHPPIAEWIPVP